MRPGWPSGRFTPGAADRPFYINQMRPYSKLSRENHGQANPHIRHSTLRCGAGARAPSPTGNRPLWGARKTAGASPDISHSTNRCGADTRVRRVPTLRDAWSLHPPLRAAAHAHSSRHVFAMVTECRGQASA